MKVALAETHITWEDKSANIQKAIEYVKIAKDKEADLLLFPEMSFTGFSMNTEKTSENDNYTINIIKKISQEYGIAIGFGWVKRLNELCENHYSICDKGELVSDYAKIHPFSFSGEDKYFVGGDKIDIFSFADFRIGIAICYDLRFPELFQIMSKEASLIIVPANWPEKRREHWMALLKARAIENQCYVAGVNCCMEMGGLKYSGDSELYNPLGERVKDCREEICVYQGEKMLLFNICNDTDKYRIQFPMKNDRREELYQKLNYNN